MRTAAISVALLAFAGCSMGTTTRFEQRRVVGITSATIGEYTVPALTIGEGPSISVFQSKSCDSVIEVEGCAVTTNRTTALGIYDSEEQKSFNFKGVLRCTATNSVPVQKAD